MSIWQKFSVSIFHKSLPGYFSKRNIQTNESLVLQTGDWFSILISVLNRTRFLIFFFFKKKNNNNKNQMNSFISSQKCLYFYRNISSWFQYQFVSFIISKPCIMKFCLTTLSWTLHLKVEHLEAALRRVLRKKCSEKMEQTYRRTPIPKCDFNKDEKLLYWNRTSAWVFSYRFVEYVQNTYL